MKVGDVNIGNLENGKTKDDEQINAANARDDAAFVAPDNNQSVGPEPPKLPPKIGVRGRKSASQLLEEELTGALASVGLFVFPFNNYDGQVIIEGSPELAHRLVLLSEKDKRVKKALQAMTTGGSYLGVLMALSYIAIPIMGNHGLIPAAAMNPFVIQSPEDNAPE